MGLITYENLEDGQKVTANVFNERFAQIIAQLNGNIDENNLADEGISKEKLKAEVYESLYPVGSMYVNFTDDTNPATLLGFGTWTAVAGRMVVGFDGTQTEFNAAEKTGGEKEVTLTEAQLAAHNHSLPTGVNGGTPANPGARIGAQYTNGNSQPTGSSTGTGDAGSGQAHNNLPPYIVGYIWKRVS